MSPENVTIFKKFHLNQRTKKFSLSFEMSESDSSETKVNTNNKKSEPRFFSKGKIGELRWELSEK